MDSKKINNNTTDKIANQTLAFFLLKSKYVVKAVINPKLNERRAEASQ